MSGIIPPSILNYKWQVRAEDPSFLNVSFPFRVKIESIWFTTNNIYNGENGLWEGVEGDIMETDRTLKLCAIKSKNAANPVDNYDSPTDFGFFFGGTDTYGSFPDESLKPTMWLGNPDDAEGRIGAFSVGTFFTYAPSLRSTAASSPKKDSPQNLSMFNTAWSEAEWNERKYKTDMSIMNVDEMLQVFVYTSSGGWAGYLNDAFVDIHVSYTGMWDESAISAPAREFTTWWED